MLDVELREQVYSKAHRQRNNVGLRSHLRTFEPQAPIWQQWNNHDRYSNGFAALQPRGSLGLAQIASHIRYEWSECREAYFQNDRNINGIDKISMSCCVFRAC